MLGVLTPKDRASDHKTVLYPQPRQTEMSRHWLKGLLHRYQTTKWEPGDKGLLGTAAWVGHCTVPEDSPREVLQESYRVTETLGHQKQRLLKRVGLPIFLYGGMASSRPQRISILPFQLEPPVVALPVCPRTDLLRQHCLYQVLPAHSLLGKPSQSGLASEFP